MRFSRFLFSAGLVLILSGCSLFKSDVRTLKPGTPKPPVLGAQVIERNIPRSVFHRALSAGEEITGLRLVLVYRRNQDMTSGGTPEYRVFGVRKGGVYDLLGLENADVLVAVQGMVLWEPALFTEYVKLLENESTTSLEIRRSGEPKLIKISFVEDGVDSNARVESREMPPVTLTEAPVTPDPESIAVPAESVSGAESISAVEVSPTAAPIETPIEVVNETPTPAPLAAPVENEALTSKGTELIASPEEAPAADTATPTP